MNETSMFADDSVQPDDNLRKNRLFTHWPLMLIFVVGLILRIQTVDDSAAHIDEAYTFSQVGKLELVVDWRAEARLPSLARWLAVPGFMLGGPGNDLSLRSSPLLGWAGLYICINAILLSQRMKAGAIAASLFLAFEPFIIGYSVYMKQDMVLAATIAAMLFAALSKRRWVIYLAVGLPLASKWTGGIMPLILVIYWLFFPPIWMKTKTFNNRMKAIFSWGVKAFIAMLLTFFILNPWYITHQPETLGVISNFTAFNHDEAISEECIGACAKPVFDTSDVWWFYVPFHTLQLSPFFQAIIVLGFVSLLSKQQHIRSTAAMGALAWLVPFVTYSFIISIDARHYAPVFLPGLLLLSGAGIEWLIIIATQMVTVSATNEQSTWIKPVSIIVIVIGGSLWASSIGPEYREWTWREIEDPYGGSTRTMWEEKIVHDEMRNEVGVHLTNHPEEEGPRICTNYDSEVIWYEYPGGRRYYWMDSIERHWGNCEFIIYSKYWVGDNLQHEGVKLLYDIWHGAEDERFKAIRPEQCHEFECHLMAFKVLK